VLDISEVDILRRPSASYAQLHGVASFEINPGDSFAKILAKKRSKATWRGRRCRSAQFFTASVCSLASRLFRKSSILKVVIHVYILQVLGLQHISDE